MKNFNKIFGIVVLTVLGSIIFSTYTQAASVGPAVCSVSPASATMPQSSSLLFTVTSDRPSVSGDYVYVTAKEFSKGVYSDLYTGKVFPIGASSLDFRVYAENTAEAGSKTFKVYCTTGCPMFGCPSGGSAEVLGSATVNLSITGDNVEAGPVVSIPPVTPPETLVPPVTNTAGKVKLTETKDLFASMFPKSVCRQGASGCRGGFGSNSSGMVPISVMLSGNTASLIGGEMIELPGGSNTAHPRLFDLSNPLAPVDSKLSGEIRSGGAYDTYGDFGSSLRIGGVAYSKDKKIWGITDSQGNLYIWKDGKRYKEGLDNSPIQGIVKVGYSYIMVTVKGDAYDVTNGMKFVESFVDLEGQTKEIFELVPAPSGFPKLPYGEKVVLGNDEFILTLNTSSQAGRTRKMSVHSVNSSNIVAEHDLPPYLGGPLPGGYNSHSSERWGTISVSGGAYVYLLRSPAWASGTDPKLYGAQKLTLYKFDFSTKKITEVVKEVSLSPGYIVANTAFGTNTSNPGIVVSSSKSSDGEVKMEVYLVSDLIQGKGVNTLSNSPVLQNKMGMDIASFSIGNTTYVYSKDGKVYKLEFDPSSGSATTPSPGSGVPYYPKTPDQPEVAGCPGGTVYQTSAGSLCVSSSGGVTTTTTFNFDNTVVQAGCFGWNAYSTSTGIKCANYSSAVNSTNVENKNGYNLGASTLRDGSIGEAVKELQRFLNSELSLSLAVDGKMGPNTVEAVKQWQSAHGLVSDGLVGPKTKAVMNAL